jgi:hypothetical protein
MEEVAEGSEIGGLQGGPHLARHLNGANWTAYRQTLEVAHTAADAVFDPKNLARLGESVPVLQNGGVVVARTRMREVNVTGTSSTSSPRATSCWTEGPMSRVRLALGTAAELVS